MPKDDIHLSAVPQGVSPTWLDITATGCNPGTQYLITIVQPGGGVTGTVTYPDASGTVRSSVMHAVYPGEYEVGIGKLHGKALAETTVTVT